MANARFRVAVQPGDGIVARSGASVLVADANSGLDTFTNPVIGELDAAGGDLTPQLAWRIAARVAADPSGAPAFALASVVDTGVRLLLHGQVRALVDGQDRVAGASALTWVDTVVQAPAAQLTLTLAESGDVVADARSDLRLGTLSGSGVALVVVDAAAAEPIPAAAAEPIPAAAAEPIATAPAEPIATAPAEPIPAAGGHSAVAAPDAPTAYVPVVPPETAGATELPVAPPVEPPVEPEQQPEPDPVPEPEPPQPPSEPAVVVAHEPAPTDELPSLAPGAEPPVPAAAAAMPPARETVALRDSLTALMSDDGVRTPLDRPYVFGREPQLDPAVAEGNASPIRLADPEQLISRVQAYVHVDGDRVTVQDAHSANGTFIAAPGAPEWQRLGTEPAELPVGWSIRMGRRIFTHFGVG